MNAVDALDVGCGNRGGHRDHLDRNLAKWQINEAMARQLLPAAVVKAIANDRRLQIMHWLRNPTAHFPRQIEGDLVKDGVCGVFIAQKLGVSQPSASEHLRILVHAGLIRGKKIKQWTFYQRNEKRIAEVKRALRSW